MAEDDKVAVADEMELEEVKTPGPDIPAAEAPKDKKEILEQEFAVFKNVREITFGVLSPTMIKKMASTKIVTPELYDKEGYPVDGGLMDIRLGVIDPGLRCKTCGSKLKECVGHFGYISLARPIVHLNFVAVILTLLRCTCRKCGRILVEQEKLDKWGEKLKQFGREKGEDAMRKKVKDIIQKGWGKCAHCKEKQFKITVEKPTTFFEDDKRISPIEIRTRLERITDDDSEYFGLNPKATRAEWMILTVMPIPPVTMRPSITLETGERSEDDLTHKLGDIVRINQRLFENINAGAPEIIVEDLWDLLQYHITTFFDNEVAQLPPARHRSGQPLKTLTERIKSKEGRIRHNLVGKRTNFSARTVISPDPMLAINEVGVPEIMALKLTVPERVTEWNKEYLKKFIEKGPKKYPGANYVVRPDGKKKKLTEETIEQAMEEIQPGYIVERHLMDGDIAIFNRQPSLHRMSMMTHKVRVLPYKTLRLNPAVCFPYNADFDGDEMNLHIPQTEEAMAEAEILMLVQTQLISPRYGLAVIGCVQDAISGNYILTQKSYSMSREDAADILAASGITELAKLPKKETITGKELFSVLLPDDFSYIGRSKSPEEPEVIIENGKLVAGVMDKNNLGEGSGLLLRNIHKKYGEDIAVDFIGKVFRLGISVLMRRGFTTTVSDTDLPEKIEGDIKHLLEASRQEVSELIRAYKQGSLEAFPGRTVRETLELKIMEVLNRARNDSGLIVSRSADRTSHTMIMALSGARGTSINLAQMAATVGQQALRGKRIEKGYTDRTLSCFERHDIGPEAHGFIKNCFKKGLNPAEFFFQAMVGRDSLMDTALRTPKSGYLYRRLANAMQDLKVDYDQTVRDASGRIIQFMYGEDGIDVSKSEAGKINVKRIINEVTGE